MNGNAFGWAARCLAVLVLTLGTVALADGTNPVHFKGLINDYSPATFVVAGVPKTVGPWEIGGTWSLDLQGDSGTANFSAVLTMELSDYAIVEGIANVDTPGTRKPHTHHITMNGATVTVNPTDCPVGAPAYTPQFELAGLADVSGNGGFAFTQVPLQVCIDGGAAVQYSNFTMVFTTPPGGSNPAAGHFGSQPIRGVVRKTK